MTTMTTKMTNSKKASHKQSHPVTNGAQQQSAPAVSSATAATPTASTPASAPTSFADRVTAAVAAIAQARSLLGLDGDVLSRTEISRAVKFKKGGEQFIPTLANLSAQYGVEVPSRPTADMTASMQRATELEPARAAISALSTIVDGAYFNSRSGTWATATSLYSMLKKGSKRDPKLAAALSPLQEYFASRHPTAVAAHPKNPVAKKATKAQAKLQQKIAKLQAQVEKLQSASPPTTEPAAAPQPQAAPPAPAPQGGAAHGS
jgi:hypothetical protein